MPTPRKYDGLVQGFLTFTYSLLIPEQGLISWGGGGGLGAVPLNSHEYTSPAFRLFNLTDLRSSSLLTYYPILIYFILAGCTQKRCVERGHPPSGAWKNGSPQDAGSKFQKKRFSQNSYILKEFICFNAHHFWLSVLLILRGAPIHLGSNGLLQTVAAWILFDCQILTKKNRGVERSKRNCSVNIRVDKCFK